MVVCGDHTSKYATDHELCHVSLSHKSLNDAERRAGAQFLKCCSETDVERSECCVNATIVTTRSRDLSLACVLEDLACKQAAASL